MKSLAVHIIESGSVVSNAWHPINLILFFAGMPTTERERVVNLLMDHPAIEHRKSDDLRDCFEYKLKSNLIDSGRSYGG